MVNLVKNKQKFIIVFALTAAFLGTACTAQNSTSNETAGVSEFTFNDFDNDSSYEITGNTIILPDVPMDRTLFENWNPVVLEDVDFDSITAWQRYAVSTEKDIYVFYEHNFMATASFRTDIYKVEKSTNEYTKIYESLPGEGGCIMMNLKPVAVADYIVWSEDSPDSGIFALSTDNGKVSEILIERDLSKLSELGIINLPSKGENVVGLYFRDSFAVYDIDSREITEFSYTTADSKYYFSPDCYADVIESITLHINSENISTDIAPSDFKFIGFDGNYAAWCGIDKSGGADIFCYSVKSGRTDKLHIDNYYDGILTNGQLALCFKGEENLLSVRNYDFPDGRMGYAELSMKEDYIFSGDGITIAVETNNAKFI